MARGNPEKLRFSQKLSRLATRLRDPEWRRYGTLLVAGKALGLAVMFTVLIGLPTLLAQAPAPKTTPTPAKAADPKAAPKVDPKAAAPDPKAAPPAKVEPKAAAPDAKALEDAKAKTASELKALEEAKGKAAGELKALEDAKAKTIAEAKALEEAKAKTAAELKALEDAKAKAAPKAEAKAPEAKGDGKEEPKKEEEEAKDPYLAVKPGDIVNPLNTVWTLVAAFLVFGMQVGFTMLEAGFCRSRETVNVLVECIVDTCLCGVLFFAFGFAFMFGYGNGFIGWGAEDGSSTWFFLTNVPATYGSTGVAFLAFWLFQFAFADTCSTITSGAMIGRTGFVGDLLYSFVVSGFIYPIIGHWTWGPDGFLALMGTPDKDGAWRFLPTLGMNFHDFAGSTVVHTIGGFVALAGAIVLGPRIGRRFKRDGGGPMLPHDLTIAACGGLLLWFGWYGFNPGSTLSAMDFEGMGRVAANTTLAACSAGLVALLIAYIPGKKWDLAYTVNGFLAGLVAITCPCYWVSPAGALGIGAIAGVLVYLGAELLEWLRIDDPIGAVPVHGINGIWGTISLGLFASGQFGATGPISPDHTAPLTGLFYGGGTQVLIAQAIGSGITTAATFIVGMVLMLLLRATGTLRISKEGELYGMDLHEHGISAYPEYVISALGAPGGMMQEIPASKPAYEDESNGEVAPKRPVRQTH